MTGKPKVAPEPPTVEQRLAELEQRPPRSFTEWLRVGFIGICFIAIIVTFLRSEERAGDIAGRVTKVESPCLRFGSESEQCKESFEAAIGTITHPEACAVMRKAGILKAIRELRPKETGTSFHEPCLGARLAQEEQRGNERRQTKESEGQPPQHDLQTGGDASAQTGSSQPSPHEGGSTHGSAAPQNQGSGTSPAGHPEQPRGGDEAPTQPGPDGGSGSPFKEATSTASQSSESTSTTTKETTVVEAPAPEPAAPVREAVGGVVEGVGATVEETGGTVNETVHGVTCTLGLAC
jgi:hypothetical protein